MDAQDQVIYPIIKPKDWVGLKSGALSTPLDIPGMVDVVIGYGYDAEEVFVFLTEEDLKSKEIAQWNQEAFENLQALPRNFEAFKEGMLLCSGKEFCSEKILDEQFMQKACELLNSDELLVSIPRRSCMYVIDKQVEEQVFEEFLYVHNHTWQDDSFGNALISPMIWELHQGKIVEAKSEKEVRIAYKDYEITQIDNKIKDSVSNAIMTDKFDAQCIFTAYQVHCFNKVYTSIQEGDTWVYLLEVTIDEEELPMIDHNNLMIEKGSDDFYHYALNRLEDANLKKTIEEARSHQRLRYLYLHVVLEEGAFKTVQIEEFSLSDDY